MKTKVAVSIDHRLIRQVDLLVRDARYPSRSQAIEEAVADHLDRVKRRRLAEACAARPANHRVAASASSAAPSGSASSSRSKRGWCSGWTKPSASFRTPRRTIMPGTRWA
jgi:Arc/MetJ-type ribon-helix-helix transcriptional regulator